MADVVQKTAEQQIADKKFQLGLWALGAAGTTIWAAKTGRKGKFWWFLGGGMIGGAIGFMIDQSINK